jgi:hypothetical protein
LPWNILMNHPMGKRPKEYLAESLSDDFRASPYSFFHGNLRFLDGDPL